MVLIISHALCASNALFASCASFTSRLTRAAAVFGGFLMVAYHKSSAAKASHVAGAGGWKTKIAGLVLFYFSRCLHLTSSLSTFARQQTRVVTGRGGHRFLVLQHEVAAPAGCRAGQTNQAGKDVHHQTTSLNASCTTHESQTTPHPPHTTWCQSPRHNPALWPARG